jgi:hypothetical protein
MVAPQLSQAKSGLTTLGVAKLSAGVGMDPEELKIKLIQAGDEGQGKVRMKSALQTAGPTTTKNLGL